MMPNVCKIAAICYRCASILWDVNKDYLTKLKTSTNEIKVASDKYIIVKNNESLDKLLGQARKIVGDLSGKAAGVHQS